MEAGFKKTKDGHAAFVKELRVLLMPDCGAWFAKSLDIDYEACGASLDEVKQNFALGLACTIHEHLKVYGDLTKVLVAASQETQNEYTKLLPKDVTREEVLSLVTFMDEALENAHIQKKTPAEAAKALLPFDGIRFIQKKPVEVAIAA